MLNRFYSASALLAVQTQCSNGKKEESERFVSERRRREARRRGSSAEGARSFNAARRSGERCKLPRPPQTTFVHFGSDNALSGKVLKGYCKCLPKIANRLCQVIFVSDWFISEKLVSHFITFTFGNRMKQISPLLICGKVNPLPLEIGRLNPASRFAERYKLPQRGLGRSPRWNRF